MVWLLGLNQCSMPCSWFKSMPRGPLWNHPYALLEKLKVETIKSAWCREVRLMLDHQNKEEHSNKGSRHSLWSHLGHQVKRSKSSIEEVVSVAAHLDGIQPVAHSSEGGVVRHTAVEERLGGPTEKERSGDKKRERGLGHARPPPPKPHPQTPHHHLSWPVGPVPATVAYWLETCRGLPERTSRKLWVWVHMKQHLSFLKMVCLAYIDKL